MLNDLSNSQALNRGSAGSQSSAHNNTREACRRPYLRGSNGLYNPCRDRYHQPLGYNSDGAALDEIADQRSRRLFNRRDDRDGQRRSSFPAAWRGLGYIPDDELDISRSTGLRYDSLCFFRNPSEPLGYNSEGAALDAAIDQLILDSLCSTHWRQPDNSRGSDALFAANRYRNRLPSGYSSGDVAFDDVADRRTRNDPRVARRRRRSSSPCSARNRDQSRQPSCYYTGGVAEDETVDQRTHDSSYDSNWRQAFDASGLDGPYDAYEQDGIQPEIDSNELSVNLLTLALQSTLRIGNDQLNNAPVVVSLKRQLEPEQLEPIQANSPEVNSLNRRHEPVGKKLKLKHTKKDISTMAASRHQRFGEIDKTKMYQQYKKNRVQERQLAIVNGLIPDPNIPVHLEDAIDFRGTCEGMCSKFEILEREVQKNVDSLETDGAKNADTHKMVKAYRRSAAGNEQQLPSDVRTPGALIMTLDYLIDKVLAQCPLDKCHAFIRDRTRSIRQDFTVQNIRDLHAIQVHERIARFHILCLHELCEYDESKFSAQQETEQLRKVLLSLMEFYDDLREEEEMETPNEAEFRAYYYITHMRDQDIARQAQALPINLFRNPYIQRALEFVAFAQRNNEIPETASRRNKPENVEACQNFYSKFFNLIADEDTPFLMACLLECNFADVRKGALKAMNVSHMLKAGGVPAEEVRQVLKYDTLEQLLKEAHLYGIIIDMSLEQPTLCFGQKHYKAKTKVFVEPLSNPSQTKSLSLVEPKRQGRSFQDIINNIVSSPCLTDDNKENDQQEQKMHVARSVQSKQKQLLEEVRLKADAAEALAAGERQKLQALVEKRQKEEQSEKDHLLKAKQNKEEPERQLQKEKEDRLQEERERHEKLLLHQENLRQVEILRERAHSSQRLRKVMNEIIDSVLGEEIRMSIIKMKRVRKYLTKKMSPKLEIARARIAKRNKEALIKQERRQFGQYIATHNPYSTILKQKLLDYRHEHSSPEEIESRVQLSIDFDELVSEDLDELSRSESEVHKSVWVKQAFAENIFHRVYDKVIYENKTNPKEYKTEWQLFISTPEKSGTTFEWYKRKFDLDDDFCRKVERYQQFDIATRIVTPETEFGAKWALDVGAIVFDLPDPGLTNEEDRKLYWEECRKRLEDLTKKIQKYSSRKVPILFTYFGDQADSKKTLEQIPKILDLGKNPMVQDYHFLIMNPKTIVVRIVDEINWLANNSE